MKMFHSACALAAAVVPVAAVSLLFFGEARATAPAVTVQLLTANAEPVELALVEDAQAAEAAAVIANDASWGSFTGQFVFDGAVPMLKPLVKKGDPAVKDPAVCAVMEVPDESLVVDPATKGIANIVVYTRKVPKVHPDLKAAGTKVIFDQKNCQFHPHVLFAQAGQTVQVLSDDAVAHNTHTFPVRNQGKNVAIKANDRIGVAFDQKVTERLPFEVKCDFHSWMKAYWLVLDHPYAAVTDAQGKFTISGLAPGKYEFIIWQEKVGYIEKSLNVEIKANATTDLKVVKVPASKFKS